MLFLFNVQLRNKYGDDDDDVRGFRAHSRLRQNNRNVVNRAA